MTTEANVIRQFIACEQRWAQTLHALLTYQKKQMGKVTTPIQWTPGSELGRLSWLGFYWAEEMFWFGYGLRDDVWRPVLDADNRSKYSSVFDNLRAELSGRWEGINTDGEPYRRVWAPLKIAGKSEQELEWFKACSRELHEFLVQP